MKIINKTHWRTDHLRAFVTRIAAEELTAAQRARTVVTFAYTSGNKQSPNGGEYCSGHASYTSGRATVRLSKHNPSKVDLAFVIGHELAHTRGMHHRSMTGDPKYNRLPKTADIYGWAMETPLDKQEPKKKSRPGPDSKLEHAQLMLVKNESRLKRQTTITKKWRAKVRYYEGRVAAVGQPQEIES